MDAPTFTKDINGYKLVWNGDLDVKVSVDRLEDSGQCELTVIYGQKMIVPYTRANLLSTTTMNQVAKRCNEITNSANVDWNTLLSYVTKLSIDAQRRGEPLLDINLPPTEQALDYLIYPILLRNEPTTIYSPGGFGKSILADLIAIMCQYNISVLDWKPKKANVLYLDWETSVDIHRRYVSAIKKGLGLTTNEQILYRFCEHDLTTEIDSIRTSVFENNIDLVIVDSQMAATSHGRPGADGAMVAGMYYNALRSLRCATLTIDHVNKAGIADNSNPAPYGSIVKYNRSRSQFELKQQQEAGEDTTEIAMYHRKFNLGKKHLPIGVQIDYYNTDNRLDKINFTSFEVKDDFGKDKIQTKPAIVQVLTERHLLTIKEIAADIGKTEGTVKTTLNRHKDIFLRVGERWSLV